jgi:hypothetical protein
MFRIKQSAIAQALQESDDHSFTAYQSADGYYTLTIDGKAMLETERGKVREFRKLGALVNLVEELGIDSFTVSLKSRTNDSPTT